MQKQRQGYVDDSNKHENVSFAIQTMHIYANKIIIHHWTVTGRHPLNK